jgi:hypothetical protein
VTTLSIRQLFGLQSNLPFELVDTVNNADVIVCDDDDADQKLSVTANRTYTVRLVENGHLQRDQSIISKLLCALSAVVCVGQPVLLLRRRSLVTIVVFCVMIAVCALFCYDCYVTYWRLYLVCMLNIKPLTIGFSARRRRKD